MVIVQEGTPYLVWKFTEVEQYTVVFIYTENGSLYGSQDAKIMQCCGIGSQLIPVRIQVYVTLGRHKR